MSTRYGISCVCALLVFALPQFLRCRGVLEYKVFRTELIKRCPLNYPVDNCSNRSGVSDSSYSGYSGFPGPGTDPQNRIDG